MARLKDRRYLVTGGSKGIGHAVARALVERGARVVVTARNEARLRAAAAEIGATGVVADVGREEDVVRSVEEAAEILGGLDGLVNNAGCGSMQPIDALQADAFRRVFDVNVLGAALMTREVVPWLRAAGGGDVVNVGSTSGLKGDPNGTLYSASKFALRGMTQCWQAELRKDDIRVILVNPSLVQTNFGRAASPAPEALRANLLHPEDVAHAVIGALEMEGRGFIPELTIYATNPWER